MKLMKICLKKNVNNEYIFTYQKKQWDIMIEKKGKTTPNEELNSKQPQDNSLWFLQTMSGIKE